MHQASLNKSISARFAQTVVQSSSQIAVNAPAGKWTYTELNRHSDFIATKILEQLGESSEPVALLLEHDAPLIAAIFGSLKANKIYLALDPSHPPKQLAAMLANSGAKLLLADKSNLTLANSFASGQLKIVQIPEKFPSDFSQKQFPEVSGDSGAWLMFTSGSTSAPKGVWQDHHGIVQEAEMYAELAHITPVDRLALLASCSLAASGATLFAALLKGATLCLFHVRSQGVERLADWLHRERITIFHSVPTVFRHLARAAAGKNSFASMRLIRLGGEPVLRSDAEIFRQQCQDDCRFMQSLSSTETGIISTFTLDKQTVLQNQRVPAGQPVRGVEIFLVDENNQPLKNDGEGKIAVRSARLRQGYWRQPELTAEKFLTDERNSALRVFISNDLGRISPDGSLEHLGRVDQLVKIRGQRVDLGEVEAALLATELAKEAVATAPEDASGERRLTAYIVPNDGADASSQNFRRLLRSHLPEPMIPNDFILLEKLPQTSGGKIDRRTLPPPQREAKIHSPRGAKPRDLVEGKLARIWESVLGVSPIGLRDDFFELGGTSLQSVEVLLHIEKKFGVSLPPSTLAEHSTLEHLAVLFADHVFFSSPSPLVTLRASGTGRPLFLIHSGQGDVASYGLLARRLPNRPIYGLQSVGLQGESWPLMNVPEMARRYLPEIIAKDPNGPYLLAGTCMGGMVALELAQLLIQQGKTVGMLALLDSNHPLPSWRHHQWKEKLYDTLRDPVRDVFRILRWSIVRGLGLGRAQHRLPAYRRFITHMNSRANRSYQPKNYPGTLTLFITTDARPQKNDRRLWMSRYARDTRNITIPGNRAGLFVKPAVDELARQLQICLELVAALDESIPARFRQMVQLHAARTALGGGAWQPTYAELDVTSNRLANVLISHGGKSGGRVALLMRQDAPLIAAALAVLKVGRIVVVLNPTDPPARLKQILEDAQPNAIITDFQNKNLAAQIAQKNQTVLSFEKKNSAPAHAPEITIAPTDVAWLIYTSGSTGRPKGVMQTHRNIVHNMRRLSRGMDLSADDRIVLLGSPSGGQGVSTTWCALLNGATLFPFPLTEKGATGLKKWLLENKITIYVSSTSVFRNFVKILDTADFFPDIKLIRFGSETAMANDVAAIHKHFPGECVLLNSLSSSETGNIAQHRFTRNDRFTTNRLPVGWPVAGMEILLLNENGREVRDGETGEIFVRSRYLSPGYWRNELLTAERFSENDDGVRVFRSGDLGRRLADGSLMFMDRKDARIKIHGYRVELSEIEDALSREAEVESALVLAQITPDGDNQLVAHIVLRASRTCTAEMLRHTLRKILPGYMVPAQFVFLKKFPLTPHGKIDREKLRQMGFSTPTPSSAEKPATKTEILLAVIWGKIFNCKAIGRHANFFDYGGDSLSAMVMAAEIYAALGVELNLHTFADHPKLSGLARTIDALHGTVEGEKMPVLTRAPRDVTLPLSFTQERIWKYSQRTSGMQDYTVACRQHIRGPLNVEILRESMSYLVRRHEILRTAFDDVDGKLAQIVHPAEPISLPLLDFTDAPDAEEKATRFFQEEARRPFDLKRLPLLRFTLLQIRENEHWLLRVNHHIISDAWSWTVYFRELALIYEAKLRGEIPSLPEFEPLQYGDYAARQRHDLKPEGSAYREMMDWWIRLFADSPAPMKLPFRRLWRSRRAVPADGVIWWGLNPMISQRLHQIARECGTTYYTIRLAAFAALLADHNRRKDVVLRTYVTGRNRVELQNMFGDFVNFVTLRLRCDPAQTFRNWLGVVRETVGGMQLRSEIPHEHISDELRKQGLKPPPIRAVFSVTTHTAPVHFGGLELTWQDRRIENMPSGFRVSFDQHNEEQRCCVTFNAKIYDPSRVRDWLDRFVRLLEVVSNHPDLPLDKLLAMTKK